MEVRLQKAIAESGLCSRRKAEELIVHGHVRVNGEIAKIGMNVEVGKDTILVFGKELKPEKKIYLMLNKPRGYLTTASDPFDRKNVLQLLHEPYRVFPVGRLDRDTTGMLLLTNDGEFANRIMHPRYEVSKTYEVTLDRKLEQEDIAEINSGVVIVERRRIVATVRRLGPKRASITIHTGLNKEVKRIFKQRGYWVEALKRTEINGVFCALKEGKYRHLTSTEVRRLLAQTPSASHARPDHTRGSPRNRA